MKNPDILPTGRNLVQFDPRLVPTRTAYERGARAAQLSLERYREQTGQEAELLSIGGGTYAKACPNLVAFGPLFPGQEMTEHQPDEYMEADTLLKNAQMMAAAIWELAR